MPVSTSLVHTSEAMAPSQKKASPPKPPPLAKMAAAVEPRDSDFSDLASTYLEGELGVDGVPATFDEGDFSSLSWNGM